MKSKNDIAWEKIFEKYKIFQQVLGNGHTSISSADINKFGREARLMTNFNHRSQLPKLFIDNDLSILPTSRGIYEIGTFKTFHEFNQSEIELTRIDFPSFLESLDYKDITSEATAINCSFVTKILQNFAGENNLFPTVCGRMNSSSFDFNINSTKGLINLKVCNSQIEIDGGFEGDNSFCLIEARNYLSNDFLVRRLFYPFKLWSNKIQKRVRPIFLTYSNGIFDLREYIFDDVNHYNSLRLIKQQKYSIQYGTINIELVQKIIDTNKTIKEPKIPFPQANNFKRVVNLCELLWQKNYTTKEEITENYDFDSRQTDYYINAGKYLGLLDNRKENGQILCYLTKTGQRLFNLSIVDRQTEFIKLILSHVVFRKILKLYFDNGYIPLNEEIAEVMKDSNLYGIDSDTTYLRRASTITGWINWILNQIEE